MWEFFNDIKNALICWLISHTDLNVYSINAVLWTMDKNELMARSNFIEQERNKYKCFTYESYQEAKKQERKGLDYYGR